MHVDGTDLKGNSRIFRWTFWRGWKKTWYTRNPLKSTEKDVIRTGSWMVILLVTNDTTSV